MHIQDISKSRDIHSPRESLLKNSSNFVEGFETPQDVKVKKRRRRYREMGETKKTMVVISHGKNG